jgi:hypothetical protein
LRPFLPPAYRRLGANGNGAGSGNRQAITRNALMAGTGGLFGAGASGVLPTGYYAQRLSGSVNAVYSTVPRSSKAAAYPGLYDDNTNSNLISVRVSGAAANTDSTVVACFSNAGNIAAFDSKGNRRQFVAEVEIGATALSGTIQRLELQVTNSTFFTNHVLINSNAPATDYLRSSRFQGILRSPTFYLNASPDGTMACNLNISASTGGDIIVDIGRMGVRELIV